MQGDREEASRVIFMGWPGQHELEDDRAPRARDQDSMTGPGTLRGMSVHAGAAWHGHAHPPL